MPRASESQRRLNEQILALLRTRGPLSGGQVAEVLGLEAFGVNLALERLHNARQVVRLGRTRVPGGRWGGTTWATVWSLAEEPDAATASA